MKKLLLIVPCFNEEKNIPLFVEEATRILVNFDWKILFINDGSRDNSWNTITQLAGQNQRVRGISFARNFGHQNALKAGLQEASLHYQSDAYAMLDADLQHPISCIPEMVNLLTGSIRIVQACRLDKKRKISIFKKASSAFFYKIFSWLSGVPVLPGASDFRLIDNHTLQFINSSSEKDLFLRGLLPWSGLNTVIFPYTPAERIHGTSRYTLKKMIALSMSGIVGYSARPLHLAIILGMISLILSCAYFFYVIIVSVFGYQVEVGWPSIIATILALGGIQLFLIGIMGIYLGKLFIEVKGRPSYVIGDKTE